MNFAFVLAQTTSETSAQTQTPIVPIDFIYEQITTLSWLQALIAISFGVVYLLYGWRIFKVLAVVSFAMLGLFLGIWAGRHFNNELIGGTIGFIVMALLSLPLMRWSVSILGAVAGGVITAGLWYALGLNENYIWAGAMVGMVAGGMISFIVFKVAVMLFSSLGGSIILATGLLALLHHYPATTDRVDFVIHSYRWFLPLILVIPTALGIYLQNKFIKESKDWDI